jgi:hypothetical protein
MSITSPRLLLTAGLLLLSSACGSTVQLSSTGSTDQGLGATTAPGERPNDGLAVPGGISGMSSGPTGPSVASLGSSGSQHSGGTTFPPVASGSSQAAAAARGPLKIGVLYPDNGAANAALGVTTDASNSPKSMMTALIAGLNHQGGLAGRKVVADFYTMDATASDYSTQANAACAHFTQDNGVPVVLDLALGNRYGMAGCLAKRGVADFGQGTTDAVSDNAVGLFASPDWMTSSRRYPEVIRGLHATGYLTSSNKIGVLLENCAYLQRAYQQDVLPEISRLGLERVDTEGIDCTTGFSSATPAASAIQSAVLRFHTDHVDRLLIVSDYEQVALELLANGAEAQGWRPGYLLSSTAQTEVMRPNIPKGQWPQLHGIGWSPGLDTDDPHKALPAASQRCLDLIKKGGVTVSGWQNTYVATTECSTVQFLGAALQRSDGNASGSALMAAVKALSTSFLSPGIVEESTLFGQSRRDGPAAVAPFAYVEGCQCLSYTGRAMSAP